VSETASENSVSKQWWKMASEKRHWKRA
jgi:hypothetical protein